MKLKDITSQIFNYKLENNYNFYIENKKSNIQEESIDNTELQFEKSLKSKNIYKSLKLNKQTIQSIYNALINSDIILRSFTLNARGKQYEAFLLYIDGMIDVKAVNDFVLETLMLRNRANIFNGSENKVINEFSNNKVTIKKVKKFDLANYIYNSLIPENSVKEYSTFAEIVSGVNSGNCALFVDTVNVAFDIDVKGFQQRGIEAPNNEVIIKGPQESFVENIRTNTSQLRRIINNENLIIENLTVGSINQTKCAVCYMQNITNSDLVAEVKYRINNLY